MSDALRARGATIILTLGAMFFLALVLRRR
jgi:hypothetical protein